VSNQDEIQKLLFDRTTPLSPDLEPYLEDTGFIGTVLKHPLVFPGALPQCRVRQQATGVEAQGTGRGTG
jgi:hypothetical protein